MADPPYDLVRSAARLSPVPFLPELRLYQAEEAADLWYLTGGEYRSETPAAFWAFAWAGGQALARFVLDHPDAVAGRSVLDLAAGSGVVGIAAAKAGAASVTAIDVAPAAVAAIDLNASANGVAVQAVLADPLLPGATLPTDVDVLLAGDVFYSPAMAQRVAALLHRSSRAGCRVLVGDADRGFLPARRFIAVASYDVPVRPALEGRSRQSATVWEMTRN